MIASHSRTRAAPSNRRRGAAWAMAGAALCGAVVVSGCDSTSSPSSEPASAPSAPASSATPGVDVESLAAGLLDAGVLGVPDDWAVRDVDPSVVADTQLAGDVDPFLGLLHCPDGTINEGANTTWLARRYSAPGVPLENGLLSIEIIVEAEDVAGWEADRDAFDDCETSEMAVVESSSTSLDLAAATAVTASSAVEDSEEVEAATLELLASPTADVPYASAFNATTANVDGRTYTVVLSGVDMGRSWQALADEITIIAIDTLRSTRPPS